MKEKTENKEASELILARAEKYFSRGNYLLAKAEFEKATRGGELEQLTEEISRKIEICVKELDKLRAKELLKKAKKLLQKQNIRDALRYYEEAYDITGEAWIQERMEGLRTERIGQDASKAAREAEAAGSYSRAAELYEQAFSVQKDQDFLVGKARCLVKAGSYQEAVEVFQSQDPAGSDVMSNPSVGYDYGFALAETGRYHDCLRIWEGVISDDKSFLDQRETVRALLTADLLDRFDRADDFARIYEEGGYLLNSMDRKGAPDIERLVEYCKYALTDSLWKEERYEAVARLLLPFPAEITPAFTAIYAKLFYKLVETTGTSLAELTLFWLTALYDGNLLATFSSTAEKREKVRDELIRRAESLIRTLVGSKDKAASKETVYWNLEKRLMEVLDGMAAGRKKFGSLVCTPRFAERFGRSADVLDMIRSNKDFFDDPERFLSTGSYYTPVRKSLYHLESGDFDEALAGLPDRIRDDEFAHYGILKVNYICGLHYLEKDGSRLGQFAEAATALFSIVPRYEEELAGKAMDAYELEQLDGYEDILTHIHRIRPSKKITEALSIVMSMRAILWYKRNRMNSKTLETILEKALKLYPQNEQARIGLDDARTELEIMEIEKALARHKMSKAFRLAEASEYEAVREQYLSFLEELAEGLKETDYTREEKLFFFEELREWCAKMDPSHPLLDRIDRSLKHLKQGF